MSILELMCTHALLSASGEGGKDMSSQGSSASTPTTAQVMTVMTPTILTPDVVEIPPTPEAEEQGWPE